MSTTQTGLDKSVDPVLSIDQEREVDDLFNELGVSESQNPFLRTTENENGSQPPGCLSTFSTTLGNPHQTAAEHELITKNPDLNATLLHGEKQKVSRQSRSGSAGEVVAGCLTSVTASVRSDENHVNIATANFSDAKNWNGLEEGETNARHQKKTNYQQDLQSEDTGGDGDHSDELSNLLEDLGHSKQEYDRKIKKRWQKHRQSRNNRSRNSKGIYRDTKNYHGQQSRICRCIFSWCGPLTCLMSLCGITYNADCCRLCHETRTQRTSSGGATRSIGTVYHSYLCEDDFYRMIYELFRARGLRALVVSHAGALLQDVFAIHFACLLLGFIDWKGMASFQPTYQPVGPSHELSDYIIITYSFSHGLTGWQFFIFINYLLFMSAWLFNAGKFFLSSLPHYIHVNHCLAQPLNISSRDLQTMEWIDVVTRLVDCLGNKQLVLAKDGQGHGGGLTKRGLNNDHIELQGSLSAADQSSTEEKGPSYPTTSVPSALTIAARITRRDNVFTTLINLGLLLPPSLPFFGSSNDFQRDQRRSSSHSKGSSLEETTPLTLTPFLEWSLGWAVVNPLLDSQKSKRRTQHLGNTSRRREHHCTLELDTGKIRFRLFLAGVLSLLAIPSSLLYLLVFTVFNHAYEFRKTSSSSLTKKSSGTLTSRKWTRYAEWLFRDINELPHLFEMRMNASEPAADLYSLQFFSHAISALASTISFVLRAIVGTMVIFALVDESLLLDVHIHDHNLLWYITLFTALLALSGSFVGPTASANTSQQNLTAKALQYPHVPTTSLQMEQDSRQTNCRDERHSFFDSDSLLMRATGSPLELQMRSIAQYTHYLPDSWRGRARTLFVAETFSQLYTLKFMILLRHLLAIFYAPLYLVVILPLYLNDVLVVMRRVMVHAPEWGGNTVCYSLMNIAEYGDPAYGGRKKRNPREEFGPQPTQLVGGKLEKSLLNFMLHHKAWLIEYNYSSSEEMKDMHHQHATTSDTECHPLFRPLTNSSALLSSSLFLSSSSIFNTSAPTSVPTSYGGASSVLLRHYSSPDELALRSGRNMILRLAAFLQGGNVQWSGYDEVESFVEGNDNEEEYVIEEKCDDKRKEKTKTRRGENENARPKMMTQEPLVLPKQFPTVAILDQYYEERWAGTS